MEPQSPIQSDTTPASPSETPVKSNPPHWIVRLLQAYPAVFWAAIWTPIFLIMLTATGNLLNLNASKRQSTAAIAPYSKPSVPAILPEKPPPITTEGRVPLWLFGAIVVSCVAGSLLIVQQADPDEQATLGERLNPFRSARKPPSRSFMASILSSAGKTTHRQPKRPPIYSPSEQPLPRTSGSFVTAPGEPIASIPVFPTAQSDLAMFKVLQSQVTQSQTVQPQATKPQVTQPQVIQSQPAQTCPGDSDPSIATTVVPDEQSHPLDWGEARLAEAVDLRRRRSVDSWM